MENKKIVRNYGQAKSPEDIKAQVLDYLYELYEDTFTIQSSTAVSWAENYETITITSEKYSGKTFLVKRIHDGSKITFIDNYFTLYMIADAEQYVREMVKEVSLTAYATVRFTEGERPYELKANAGFGDYVKMGGSPYCYIILTSANELKKEEQLSFMRLLSGKKFQCNVVFESNTSSHRYGVDSDNDIRDYN